jgi:hypothetical protein
MEGISVTCPVCRHVCDPALVTNSGDAAYCPIALENVVPVFIFSECGHTIGADNFDTFVQHQVHPRSSLLTPDDAPEFALDIFLEDGDDTIPPPPPPSLHPPWHRRHTVCRFPEFVWEGTHVMWVHNAYAYNDVSLVNLDTGNMWDGGVSPPPPVGTHGVVKWLRRTRRWVFFRAPAFGRA